MHRRLSAPGGSAGKDFSLRSPSRTGSGAVWCFEGPRSIRPAASPAQPWFLCTACWFSRSARGSSDMRAIGARTCRGSIAWPLRRCRVQSQRNRRSTTTVQPLAGPSFASIDLAKRSQRSSDVMRVLWREPARTRSIGAEPRSPRGGINGATIAGSRDASGCRASGVPQRLATSAIPTVGVARHVAPVLGELQIIEPPGDILRRDGALAALRRPAPVDIARALAQHGLPPVCRHAGRRLGAAAFSAISTGAIHCTWVVRNAAGVGLAEP